jgi:hypothetical protein
MASRKLALVMAGVAGVAIGALVVQQVWLAEQAEPAASAETPMPAPMMNQLLVGPEAPPPPATPEIKGVKIEATPIAGGIEMKVDVAFALQANRGRREMVSIKARCLVGNEWLDSAGHVSLGKLGGGTSAVSTKLTIRGVNDLIVTPTVCHLAFDHNTGVRPYKRTTLAHKCWDGTSVLDKPCAPVARGDAAPLALDDVKIASSLQRWRTTTAGTPQYLDVTIAGRVRASMRDWMVELASDCKMPDGTTQSDRGTISLYTAEVGEPFTKQTTAFFRSKLPVDPASCTMTFELVDRQRLVREPLSTQCWRAGTVDRGSCV